MLSWQIGIASAPKAVVAGNGGKVQLLQTADNIFSIFLKKCLQSPLRHGIVTLEGSACPSVWCTSRRHWLPYFFAER